MQPTMNLDTSAQTQNLQAAIKAADLDAMLHMEFTRKNKNWSDKPTSPHTTSFAEGLLKVEYERSKLKNVKRTGSKTFEVEMKDCVNAINPDCPPFDVDDADEFKHVPIPLFHRTRVVTVDDKQTMFCSCSKFECRGYFCADQVCVAEKLFMRLKVFPLLVSPIITLHVAIALSTYTWHIRTPLLNTFSCLSMNSC